MTTEDFDAFCGSLSGTTTVIQWGGSHVRKVGGKVFAICGWQDEAPAFTFKVSEMAFEVLQDVPGLRPAPYLASRGLKWIQHYATPGLEDEDLRAYLRASYQMIADALPRKTQAALGLA